MALLKLPPKNPNAWWSEFIRQHAFVISTSGVDKALEPYNGSLLHIEAERYVSFKSEEDRTFFMLKWM